MARVAVGVTVAAAANPTGPGAHKAAATTAGAETGNVYVSFDTTKITGFNQLVSAVNAALVVLANGNFGINT